MTGHFTAMNWNGAQEIGCMVNSHNLVACRYKGSDSPTCRTPNMGGEYKANVFAKVRTLEQCTAMVDQCGIGSGGCGKACLIRSSPCVEVDFGFRTGLLKVVWESDRMVVDLLE